MPEHFMLDEWYGGEAAKRAFGKICQAVNEEHTTIELMGSEDRPLLVLTDADSVPVSEHEVELSIEEAKSEWSAITAAALFYGTTFRIRGKRKLRAVLTRHTINRHNALKYRRPQTEDIPQTVENMLQEMSSVTQHFDQTVEILNRRFRDLWRVSEGMAVEKPLPFASLVPNAETTAAMEEARRGGLPRVSTVEEFLAELNAGD